VDGGSATDGGGDGSAGASASASDPSESDPFGGADSQCVKSRDPSQVVECRESSRESSRVSSRESDENTGGLLNRFGWPAWPTAAIAKLRSGRALPSTHECVETRL
jgi:hypothetical protein